MRSYFRRTFDCCGTAAVSRKLRSVQWNCEGAACRCQYRIPGICLFIFVINIVPFC